MSKKQANEKGPPRRGRDRKRDDLFAATVRSVWAWQTSTGRLARLATAKPEWTPDHGYAAAGRVMTADARAIADVFGAEVPPAPGLLRVDYAVVGAEVVEDVRP